MNANLFFKRQPPQPSRKEPQLSFVALVKERGDGWAHGLPSRVNHQFESLEPGYREFHRMKYLEIGMYSRIEPCAELYE